MTPDELYAKGVEARSVGQGELAYKLFTSVVAQDAEHAGGWYQLGVICEEAKRWASAAAAFRRCEDLRPGAVETATCIGWNLHLAGRSEEALGWLRRAVEIGGERALAHTDLSHVLETLGLPGGVAAARRGVDCAPDGVVPRLALGFALLHEGEWAEGFREFEARIAFKMKDMLSYPLPRWRGEWVNRLFLQAEQGLGDSVMMLRYLGAVSERVGQVVFMVQKELVGLVREGWPGIEVVAMPGTLPAADAWCPLMGLPEIVGVGELPGEPYIGLRDDLFVFKDGLATPIQSRGVTPFPTKREGRLAVGLCWAGSADHDNDQHRSMRLVDLLPLAEVSVVDLLSLQVGARAKEIGEAGAYGLVRDMSPEISDMRDTAAIIAGLDLVVSVDTAVAHLAGAMGKETWLLVNQRGLDWRWGRGGERTPWYGNLRLFKRSLHEGWDAVVMRVCAELRDRVAAEHERMAA